MQILEDTGRHMCLCNTYNFPYPRKNHFSIYGYVLPIVPKKQEVHMRSISLLPKGCSIAKVKVKSSKRQGKDYHYSEIQYDSKVKDDLVNPSYQLEPE